MKSEVKCLFLFISIIVIIERLIIMKKKYNQKTFTPLPCGESLGGLIMVVQKSVVG
jgi:hypothetical protein